MARVWYPPRPAKKTPKKKSKAKKLSSVSPPASPELLGNIVLKASTRDEKRRNRDGSSSSSSERHDRKGKVTQSQHGSEKFSKKLKPSQITTLEKYSWWNKLKPLYNTVDRKNIKADLPKDDIDKMLAKVVALEPRYLELQGRLGRRWEEHLAMCEELEGMVGRRERREQEERIERLVERGERDKRVQEYREIHEKLAILKRRFGMVR